MRITLTINTKEDSAESLANTLSTVVKNHDILKKHSFDIAISSIINRHYKYIDTPKKEKSSPKLSAREKQLLKLIVMIVGKEMDVPWGLIVNPYDKKSEIGKDTLKICKYFTIYFSVLKGISITKACYYVKLSTSSYSQYVLPFIEINKSPAPWCDLKVYTKYVGLEKRLEKILNVK